MRTKPVSMESVPLPTTTIRTYRDTNGNWFAEITTGKSICWTSTFTDEREAIAEASGIVGARNAERDFVNTTL